MTRESSPIISDRPLTLVHLSDIHFQRGSDSDPYSLGSEIKNSLERDAGEMAKQLKPIYGVVVTGDIAFAGNEEEYTTAENWLEKFCRLVECPQEHVWTIPGNHDVSLRAVDANMLIQDIRNSLRQLPVDQIDHELRRRLRDPGAGRELFSPLAAYNKFASKFECRTTPEALWWDDEIFLNDGSILRMRGVNSVLLSDSRVDDDAANKLLLGTFQASPSVEDGVEYLVLCHHPPEWLKDHDAVEDWLLKRCRIQLFGHKHRQRMVQLNETLRVTAGAMLPEKREPNWEPRYNFLRLFVRGEKDSRKLCVDIFPRVWSEPEKTFMADRDEGGSDKRSYELSIGNWERPMQHPASEDRLQMVPPTRDSSGPARGSPECGEGQIKNPGRRLTYRFLSLSYQSRLDIAQKLDLIRNEDEGIDDTERYSRIFGRAREEKKLERLWQAVEEAHGEPAKGLNPYIGK